MQSWEEYIKSNALEFRKKFSELPEEKQEKLKKNPFSSFSMELMNPCQVIVVKFKNFCDHFLIVSNSKKSPDLEIMVYDNVDFKTFWDDIERESKIIKIFGIDRKNFIETHLSPVLNPNQIWNIVGNDKVWISRYSVDIRNVENLLADNLFNEVKKI